MIRGHRIPENLFHELTDGPASPPTLALLRSSQLSKHKLLLVYLQRAASEFAECAAALEVLVEADRRAPRQTGELIVGPAFGAWAVWCVRRLHGTVPSTTDIRVDLGHLTALAAVAALRAGLDVELDVRTRQGTLYLPTLGALRLADAGEPLVRVRVRDGDLVIDPLGRPVPAVAYGRDAGPWQATRTLRARAAGMDLTVSLEDLDPYRGCHGKPTAPRLSAAEFDRWAQLFQDAWTLLTTYAPGRARELGGGLRALVPLSTAHAQRGLSSTSRSAFGAAGLTLPARPEYLAVTLVHEFQHSKLSAVLDLLALYDAGAQGEYFAPWRPDPRPVGGLLQGAYAFAAVSQLWYQLRGQPAVTSNATRHCAELREQVRVVLDTLDRAPHLNADGRGLVEHLSASHAQLMALNLPKATVDSALAALDATYADWSIRHGAQTIGSA